MERKYACYCGLYCGNCAVKVKVESAARTLYEEMGKLGFEQIMPYFPDGDKFWSFLKAMSTEGICISCKVGSGNPACQIRQCAQKKKVDMCALCESYPCDAFKELSKGYPSLHHDNCILREKGWESWGEMQNKRQAEGLGVAYDENESQDPDR